jgi:hypothetical protein
MAILGEWAVSNVRGIPVQQQDEELAILQQAHQFTSAVSMNPKGPVFKAHSMFVL